ncbi:hypothetical protein RFH42_12365 [Acinetobacter rudis]|uniref:hypothetical protein n=1 Tax=Acinetobacter rudis TaxID=632955 RepID=UPI00280E6C9A|nr:hypothetical protein [Acinetobacter rudis]MDQ8953749.1 hypothetical protein [Acinetobacter rudis]
MIFFTDLNFTKHAINLANLNNVQLSEKNGALVMSFHMVGPHVIPATVDRKTADRLMKELESQHE